ncbi:MAG: type II secretion system protein [Planctomycetota bacterium]|nr:type II secretion system protein [Planctomycetota bacterium]
MRTRAKSTCRPAFTMIEMLLAFALAAIVLSALQSLILIAGRAIPDAQGVQSSTVEAADMLERLTAEVSVAIEVLEVNANDITFSLNDWTGDSVVETVRYAWSGVVGDPLLRAVNGGAASVLVGAVDSFTLSPVTQSTDIYVVGNEQTLDNQLVQSVSVLDAYPDPVNTTGAYAQRIVPDLPADTVDWRIRDVSFWIQSESGSDGKILVEIRNVDAITGLPGNIVYKEKRYKTSSLGSDLTRVDLGFDTVRFSPTDDVCLVIRAEDPVVACDLEFGLTTAFLNGRVAWKSSDGGSSWSAANYSAMHHEITAEIRTQTATIETRTELVELEGTLVAGVPAVTIKRSVRPLNTPEVLP